GDNVDLVLAQLNSVAQVEQEAISLLLTPFSTTDAVELAASMLQMPSDAQDLNQFVAHLASKRTLTPLYVEQSLWALFSTGSLAVTEAGKRWQGYWHLDEQSIERAVLPASIREAIGNRASRLSAETLRMLGIAAVAGKTFDVEVMARAADSDAKDVLTACEQA